MEVTSYAHENGIHTLYKYMAFAATSEEHQSRALALLSRGLLYFPIASQLNDPFDSTPHFRFRGSSPAETLAMLTEDVERFGAERGWNAQKIADTKRALADETEAGFLEAKMGGLNEKWRHLLRTNYPMCCLSATRASTLMWAYYSGGHTGICVHFDATRVPFATAQRVLYSEEYPLIRLPSVDGAEPKAMVTQALLTKSCVWKHEEEYRIVNLPMTEQEDSPPRMLDSVCPWISPRMAMLPSRLIRAVTIGAAMPEKDVEAVLRAAHDAKPRIPVDRAICREDRYDLEFETVTG